jgi:hypothetical protein
MSMHRIDYDKIAQLTVVALACAVALPFRNCPAAFRRILAIPASCLIAITRLAWTIGRLHFFAI